MTTSASKHGWGIRVGYPSTRLLAAITQTHRRQMSGRIVIALTANPYYTLQGVKPGTSLKDARTKLHLGHGFSIGRNTWYIAPGPHSSFVLKVRHGIVQEIGIATRALTSTCRQQRDLRTSF